MVSYFEPLSNLYLLSCSIYVGSTTAFNAFVGSFVLMSSSSSVVSYRCHNNLADPEKVYCSNLAAPTDTPEEHSFWAIPTEETRGHFQRYRLWILDCLVHHLLLPFRSTNHRTKHELCVLDLGSSHHLCDRLVVRGRRSLCRSEDDWRHKC